MGEVISLNEYREKRNKKILKEISFDIKEFSNVVKENSQGNLKVWCRKTLINLPKKISNVDMDESP